jgi:hypothetical protein
MGGTQTEDENCFGPDPQANTFWERLRGFVPKETENGRE